MKASGITRSILSRLPPETAHALTLGALRFGIRYSEQQSDPDLLNQNCFGLQFDNPIGLAAGFDKDAKALSGLLKLGFGAIEVGTITPQPQKGNQKPRVFRLPEDGAVINRLGFNNEGVKKARTRLARLSPNHGIIGANIGPNRNSDDPIKDYRECFTQLAPLVDYLVVNISSPNTPGLRAWQGKNNLTRLISNLHNKRSSLPHADGGAIPLLIKLAPDLNEPALEEIADVAIACKVDGLIISNTTVQRPTSLVNKKRDEIGGLSGRPLFDLSTRMLANMHRRVDGTIPLIGIGGISSGEDAYTKIRAGASLVQLYTGFIYEGPQLLYDIKTVLAKKLTEDGFSNISAAVGIDSSQY